MPNRVREAILQFVRQLYTDPLKADASVLESYRDVVRRGPAATDLAPDAVHDAFALYLLLKDREANLDLLRRYLARPLPLEEEAWARWNLVDHLALLRRCDELVPAHNALLEWSDHKLDPDRLFWVMHDGTQAHAWFLGGHGGEWMKTFWDLNGRVAPSARNRLHRYYHHESAARALTHFERPREALPITDRMLVPCPERWSDFCAICKVLVRS